MPAAYLCALVPCPPLSLQACVTAALGGSDALTSITIAIHDGEGALLNSVKITIDAETPSATAGAVSGSGSVMTGTPAVSEFTYSAAGYKVCVPVAVAAAGELNIVPTASGASTTDTPAALTVSSIHMGAAMCVHTGSDP